MSIVSGSYVVVLVSREKLRSGTGLSYDVESKRHSLDDIILFFAKCKRSERVTCCLAEVRSITLSRTSGG